MKKIFLVLLLLLLPVSSFAVVCANPKTVGPVTAGDIVKNGTTNYLVGDIYIAQTGYSCRTRTAYELIFGSGYVAWTVPSAGALGCTPPSNYSGYETSRVISGIACNTPTCSDGVLNGTETGIDCGGSCAPCPPTHCTNTVKDGDEIGVDCGGSCAAVCIEGECPAPSDPNTFVRRLCASFEGKETCSCDYITDPYPDNKCPDGYEYMSNRPFYDPISNTIIPGSDPVCYKKTNPPKVAPGSPAPPPEPPLTYPGTPPGSPPPSSPPSGPEGSTERTTKESSETVNPDGSKTVIFSSTTITTNKDGSMSRQTETTTIQKDPAGNVTGEQTVKTGVPGKGSATGDATSDDLKKGLDDIKGSSDSVREAVVSGTGILGGKLDGISAKLDGLGTGGSTSVTVNNSGVEEGLDEIKGDGSFVGPVAPANPEFNTSTLDSSLSGRVQVGVNKLKSVYSNSPVGSYLSTGFGTLSGPSDSSMSVNMGSYGQKSVDFGPWASSLGLLRLFLLAAAGVVCLRIVIMKQH